MKRSFVARLWSTSESEFMAAIRRLCTAAVSGIIECIFGIVGLHVSLAVFKFSCPTVKNRVQATRGLKSLELDDLSHRM